MRNGIPFRVLADELNVSIQMLWDFIHAGHLHMEDGGGVTKDSADELRWRLAMHKPLLSEDDQ